MFERNLYDAEDLKARRIKRRFITALMGFVATGILGLTDSSIGLTLSIGIPRADANITAGGAVGHPEQTEKTFPDYVRRDVNSTGDGWNWFQKGHIAVVGQQTVFIAGQQRGAPAMDLHVSFQHGRG
jgi:hypothetical protein